MTIQGLVWRLFLYPLGGPVDSFLGLFGAQSELLGGRPMEAFVWVVTVQIWANMGITMVIFLAGLQTIPDELIEAARIDGASRWQTFRHVTWPLLTPSVNTNLILSIIGSLQAWQLFLVLTGYRPGTQVLGYVVYAQAFGQTSGSTDLEQLPPGLRRGRLGRPVRARARHRPDVALCLLRRREERLLG